ncbi:hypothetical protein D3C80_1422730 [compost metagenome]
MAKDGIAGIHALAIDQDQRIAAAQPADTDALTVIAFIGDLHAGDIFQYVFEVLYRFLLQVFAGDHADSGGRIFEVLFNRGSRHHHLIFFFFHFADVFRHHRTRGSNQLCEQPGFDRRCECHLSHVFSP